MTNPLLKGGQGRTTQSIEDSAQNLFCLILICCIAVLVAAITSQSG